MSAVPKTVIKTACKIVGGINADFTGDGRVDDDVAIHEQKRVARVIVDLFMNERTRCAGLVRQLRFMDEFDREALISAIMEPSDDPKNKDQWASESGE